MRRALLLLVLVLGCADRPLPDNEGTMTGTGGSSGTGTGGTSGSGGSGGSGGMLPDASIDGARHHDASIDAAGGQSCLQVVLCAFQCNQDLSCVQGCCQMGTPQACQEAQALLLCAVGNCVGSIGNPIQLFQCLSQHCPQQLSTCTGF